MGKDKNERRKGFGLAPIPQPPVESGLQAEEVQATAPVQNVVAKPKQSELTGAIRDRVLNALRSEFPTAIQDGWQTVVRDEEGKEYNVGTTKRTPRKQQIAATA